MAVLSLLKNRSRFLLLELLQMHQQLPVLRRRKTKWARAFAVLPDPWEIEYGSVESKTKIPKDFSVF